MALLAKRNTNSADSIPRRSADPAWSTASALLSVFQRRHDRLRQERDRLILERDLGGRPIGEQRGSSRAQLEWRLAQLRKLPPLTQAETPPAPSDGARSEAISKAIALCAGKIVAAPPTFSEQVGEIDRQILVLDAAIFEQQAILEAAEGSFNYAASLAIAPVWHAHAVAVYRACQELSRVARQFRQYRAELITAGISTRSDILHFPTLRSPAVVGDESEFGSEISVARRQMESWGLL